MIKNIIIFGPPGSGKGTQAQILAKKLGFFYFGTGDLMRQEAARGTALGKKFQAVWDRGKGELVSEDLVAELVKTQLAQIPKDKGVVFDGFPRTLHQAQILAQILGERGGTTKVLNLNVSRSSLLDRATTRRVCAECGQIYLTAQKRGNSHCKDCDAKLIQRQEDTPEVVQKRLEVYEEQTKPVLDFYRDKGELTNIDGEPPIEEVTREIDEVLKQQDEN